MSLRQQIMAEFAVRPSIDPQAEIERRVQFLCDFLKRNPGLNGFVMGISGGVDSAVAAALAKVACDRMGKRALGLYLPYHNQPDIEDAYAVGRAIGLETMEINIGPAVDMGAKALGDQPDRLRLGNRKARQRMVEWYDVAQKFGLAVVGSDNAAEVATGFFTKGAGGDILPLRSLDKQQVWLLAEAEWPFGRLPREVVTKVPTAGLWEGQTDEDELGVSYTDLCAYLQGKPVDARAAARIEQLYERSQHKRHIPWI